MIIEINWGTENYPRKKLYEQVTDEQWHTKIKAWKNNTSLPMPMPFGHIMFINPENKSGHKIVTGQQTLF